MANINFLKISKFFLYLAPFSAVIVYRGTLFPFIVGKYAFFRAVIDLALIFFVWAWASGEIQDFGSKIKNFFKQPLAVIISIFVFLYLLSGFFGYNPAASFWSNFERGEGGLQIIHFFIFFFLMVLLFESESAWRKMFVISSVSALLVIGYGILGSFGFANFVGQNLCLRFSGSLGNPAYVGTYMIFAIFYSLYLAISDWNIGKISLPAGKKWLWLGLAILFFIFLLLSQTRGAVLGMGMGILAFLGYLFFTLPDKKHRWFVLFLISFLVILGTFAIKYRQSIDLMPFCREQGGGNRILDITLNTETAKTRLLLWKQSIIAFKERPILGWGPENFTAAFEKHYDPAFEVWYDRAHNIFFDYLVMTGIIGLLSFIGIFLVYYWQFFKKAVISDNKLLIIRNALLFALPIAYLIQGLVLFDVLPIYINLFIFLAFASYKFQNFKF
ncbi:O-antigen ligase family protein [Candidatus Wolfebacteria bacterium]|nr:O-antigen ligase family protein [Candidatus Wolfebacteria bacterium]